jgi:hypothetical protein
LSSSQHFSEMFQHFFVNYFLSTFCKMLQHFSEILEFFWKKKTNLPAAGVGEGGRSTASVRGRGGRPRRRDPRWRLPCLAVVELDARGHGWRDRARPAPGGGEQEGSDPSSSGVGGGEGFTEAEATTDWKWERRVGDGMLGLLLLGYIGLLMGYKWLRKNSSGSIQDFPPRFTQGPSWAIICVVYYIRKSPSHVPYLLSKSDFGPLSTKSGIWGPSTIKPIYFWSLGCFGRWFSHDLAATRYMRSLSCEIYLF